MQLVSRLHALYCHLVDYTSRRLQHLSTSTRAYLALFRSMVPSFAVLAVLAVLDLATEDF